MKGVRKERSLPGVGSSYVRKWRGKNYNMLVIKDGDKIKFKVDNILFSSPSGAAKYITEQEINGWRFWRLDKLDKEE